ncbi:MAG: PCMD domain-containing protein [Bacteroidales bacterium]|nr:PCMD domain-containing protein [Bacteroidales bacterium]
MRKFILMPAVLLAAVCCTIKNDLDYPSEIDDILAVDVDDAKSVTIDRTDRTVVIDFQEWADISSVAVNGMLISEGMKCDLPEILDLRHPVSFSLSGYRTYQWTISGTQSIERHITCTNQVGEAKFNLEKKIAFIYFPESQPLTSIEFTDLKLEPERSSVISTTGYSMGATTSKATLAVNLPMTLDCQLDRVFTVQNGDQLIDWTVRAIQVKVKVKIDSVRPYCYSARIRGIHPGNGSPKLQYRLVSSHDWKDIPVAVVAGTGISAILSGLSEDTGYAVRVVDGEDVSEEVVFKTDKAAQLDNMSFDSWHQDKDGKVWYPYPDGGTEVWATANPATGSFLGNTTVPDAVNVAVQGAGKKSALMESSFMAVKFAAGNLFTGQFVKLVGLGAELAWGIPFTSRPKSLKGFVNYIPKPVDYADETHKYLLGANDTGRVFVVLADWDEQFHVISTTGQYLDLQKNPGIIAFGEYHTNQDTGGFKPFEIELEYRSDERIPKWVVIVASSSSLGDYFTGGTGSKLWVDEFSFEYE